MFCGGEDIGRSVIDKRFACEWGGDSFVEESADFEEAFVGAVRGGDLNAVADLNLSGWLQGFRAAFDFAARAFFGGEGARLEESHGPEPFVDADGVGHELT